MKYIVVRTETVRAFLTVPLVLYIIIVRVITSFSSREIKVITKTIAPFLNGLFKLTVFMFAKNYIYMYIKNNKSRDNNYHPCSLAQHT